MRIRARAPVILAIIAMIYCFLPLVFGIFAKDYSLRFITQANESIAKVAGIQLKLERYKRGWFHSTALLAITTKNSDGTDNLIQQVPLKIYHGPFYQSNTHPGMGLALMTADDITIDALPKYHVLFQNNIGLSGDRALLALVANSNVDMPSTFDATKLQFAMRSNLEADHFSFELTGTGLHYQSPDHLISASIEKLDSTLFADYLSDRHWQLHWGFSLDRNKLSISAQNSAPPFVFAANQLNVGGLHLDTEKMAKLLMKIADIKNADAAGQTIYPSVWVAIAQEFLTQVIGNDTHVWLHNLSVTSPAGQVMLHYTASFPQLPSVHDYFDITTRDVSQFALNIPDWIYTDAESQMAFSLSQLKLLSQNNTVFSRQTNLSLGSFNIRSMKADAVQQMPLFYGTGVAYQGRNYGDMKAFSQTMAWQANNVCFSQDCFKAVKGELSLQNMNFAAFHNIAVTTRSFMQYDPQASAEMRWHDLAAAYIGLVTPATRFGLSQEMQTTEGPIKVEAALSWPDFSIPPGALPNTDLFLDKAHYNVRAQIPVAYLNAFLTNTPASTQQAVVKPEIKSLSSGGTFVTQAADFVRYALSQGYLKKVDNAYVVDLSGVGSQTAVNGVSLNQGDGAA